MDWFHCNRCFRQDGAGFSVTSCGHVLCQTCGAAGPCPVCGAACGFLALGQQLRPQERRFFRSPADTARSRLRRLHQVWRFQRAQDELRLTRHREAAARARRALEEAQRLLHSLQRENAELRRARLSPAWPSRSSAPRPVGVTSPAQPVPPRPRRLSGHVVSRSASATPPGERPQIRGFLPQIPSPGHAPLPRDTPPRAEATPPFPNRARWLAGAHRSA
ncbi:RING finger protein 212B [Caloenas nicobarica]|uniref:RING finger protein 212B n=1 Tax=Caloenas nicobarica TaxID=187106 RepID=UPI0032B802A9